MIALLVVNVLIFAWLFNEHVGEKAQALRGARALPANTPTLRLVSELDELPPLRESANTTQAPAAPVAPDGTTIEVVDLSTEINSDAAGSAICVRVGPVNERAQLDTLRTWLRERTTVVHTRAETVREQRFFWVYLEPKSDEEAQRNLEDLKRRGVTDYLLIRRGGLRNAISLGLFRSQDSVNRRLAEMSQKGYKPVVVPQFESTQRYWVSARMLEDADDPATIPTDVLADATLAEIDCARLETAGSAAAP